MASLPEMFVRQHVPEISALFILWFSQLLRVTRESHTWFCSKRIMEFQESNSELPDMCCNTFNCILNLHKQSSMLKIIMVLLEFSKIKISQTSIPVLSSPTLILCISLFYCPNYLWLFIKWFHIYLPLLKIVVLCSLFIL